MSKNSFLRGDWIQATEHHGLHVGQAQTLRTNSKTLVPDDALAEIQTLLQDMEHAKADQLEDLSRADPPFYYYVFEIGHSEKTGFKTFFSENASGARLHDIVQQLRNAPFKNARVPKDDRAAPTPRGRRFTREFD